MEIVYLGHSAFRLKGKTATVVTDPYGAIAGKFPKDTQADIVTLSHGHDDHNQASLVKGSPFVVDGPGEYDVKDVAIIGVAGWHDDKSGEERGSNTMFVIEMDGLRIAHLGDVGHKLTEAQLEEMGSIDVAMVPVGGSYTVDAKGAVDVVRQVDPWIVIPMHYQQEGLDAKAFAQLGGVELFLKELSKEVASVPKLQITADKLPTELTVVVLERKS